MEGVLQEARTLWDRLDKIEDDIRKLKSAFGGMSIVVD